MRGTTSATAISYCTGVVEACVAVLVEHCPSLLLRLRGILDPNLTVHGWQHAACLTSDESCMASEE